MTESEKLVKGINMIANERSYTKRRKMCDVATAAIETGVIVVNKREEESKFKIGFAVPK